MGIMNNRIIIIILSSIIVIQMIAGVFILRRDKMTGPSPSPFGFMEDRMGMEPGKHRMMGNRFGRSFCEPEFMKDRLSMNQEQIDKITTLNKKFDTEFASYITLIEPEKKRLKTLLDNDTDDMTVVKEQLKKIEALNVEIHLLRIKQGKEISQILTPEQMDILRGERKMLFEKMRRNHGGMR
jgi:Spy/CpxP family protein refolding chaperone